MPLSLSAAASESSPPAGVAARETRLDRLLKMIPAEVLLVYPAVQELGRLCSWRYLEPILVLVGGAAAAGSLACDARRTGLAMDWRHAAVRGLVFAAWSLVLGQPLAELGVATDNARALGAAAVAFVPVIGYVLLAPE